MKKYDQKIKFEEKDFAKTNLNVTEIRTSVYEGTKLSCRAGKVPIVEAPLGKVAQRHFISELSDSR